MRRLSVPLLVGLALLVTPLTGAAQDYTPIFRSSTFVPIDPHAPGVTAYGNLLGNTTNDPRSVDQVLMPFPFIFYGQVFNQLNISRHGYVTFSPRPNHDEKSGGYSDSKVRDNQFPLPQSASPNGLIAAWWDDLACPSGTVKTQDAVIQGNRTFTVEWNGCYLSTTANTVQMQVRFTEGSSVIRVYYGELGGTAAHSATVGIEDPVVWHQDPITKVWTLLSSGGIDGAAPRLTPACAADGCTRESWPANTMIQYGRPELPDLQAGVLYAGVGEDDASGLEIIGLSGIGTVTIELRNTIENSGLATASGVIWDYYLSIDDDLDPDMDTLLGHCRHSNRETIPGATVVSFTDSCTVDLDPGFYRICTFLDPVTASEPKGAIAEASEDNNTYCSAPFSVGADLLGSLTMPADADAGGTIDVPVRIENRGSDPARDFTVQIWLRDCVASNANQNILAWETRLSLDGGRFQNLLAEVPIRPDLRAPSYCAVLVIDPEDVIREQDENNNVYSSCVPNGDLPAQCAVLALPNLQIRELTVDLPNGCFFGEPIDIAVRVCNDGIVDARSFGVAFYLDINANFTIEDTMILAIPQSCYTSDECVPLGGGAPTCVEGICHAPCEVDTDCGTGGLQCEPSFAIPGKSCQLAIEADSCRWVGAIADLPTLDARANAEFQDGDIFFGALVDWTDKVAEIREGEGNTASAGRNACWMRKPDFEAVEIRTLPEIAPGETVPVYRRLGNRGIEGGTFGYRYVLSSNDTISANDLALEIEDVGAIVEETIGPRSEVAATDLVRLPSGIVSGEYYLGIILDPDDRIAELNKDNNTARTDRLWVVDASLRIVTSSLRNATVDTIYAVQLIAAGGQGELRWSHTAGDLPPGTALGADGLFHGTPSEVGTYLFRVTVSSDGNTASRYLAFDVLEARGPLTISSTVLPPAFQNVEYRVTLGASGGLPPYTWSCSSLPDWLQLRNNLLHGTSMFTAAPFSFVCMVSDENETTASREYRLGVYPASGIRIRSQELTGDVGNEFSGCITAEGGSGLYNWFVDSSSLPAGIRFAEQDNAACFSGAPKECGTYLVGLTATDEESGLFDTRRFSLTVYCRGLRLTTRNLPTAERGVSYAAQLETNSSAPVGFELAGGALPRGLSLSSDGRITGVVAVGATAGSHEAAVRFYDEEGASGVGAISIAVAGDAGPDLIITHTETRSGCSASGQGSAAGLWPLALLAFLGLVCRRNSLRPAATAGLTAAALLLPAAVVAQTSPWFATHHYPKPYERLTEGTVVTLPGADEAVEIVLDGWTVPFFGENYGKLWFHENGLILFSKLEHSGARPYPIPYIQRNTPTRNFIAGWWGNHVVTTWNTSLRYLIRGTAPDRELVLQWIWLSKENGDGTDGGEHQVSIFEDGTITFRWGKIVDSGKNHMSHQAVMGMMDAFATRYVPFHDCSVHVNTGSATAPAARCDGFIWANQLQDTEAAFTTLPNLQIRSAATDGAGLAGVEQTFSAIVYNHGPFPTTARVRFYASRDEQLSKDDIPIGTSEEVEVGSYAERVVELEAALPPGLEPGRNFLIAVVDPDNEVKEFIETDNVGPALAFPVGEPQADLTVLRVTAPPSGAPGSTITVRVTAGNLGNLDGIDFPYVIVLSENPVITLSDRILEEGTMTAGALQTLEQRVPVTIPFGISPGEYHLGVVIDPHVIMAEFNTINNSRRAEQSFVVAVSGLVVRTIPPRSVQIGTVFCVPLVAEGGDGVYTWNLVDGTLPPGLELIPGGEAGDAALCGRPSAMGLYDLTLEVISGNLAASTEMTIEVTVAVLEFGISSRELLTAQFQHAYEAGLVAFGGTPPYTWALVDGDLPVGLSFDDDGLLFGTPLEAGPFSFGVSVSDATGKIATETVALLVVPPSRITCSTQTLGTIALGQPFAGKLLAAGGPGSNEWSAWSIRRVGDAGAQPIDGTAPPGLELDSTGEITGIPEQVGSYIWTLEVRSAVDGDFDICLVTVTVAGGQRLTVVTTDLPNAVPDEEYAVRLRAINGHGNLTWSLATGALPDGLSFDSTGLLYGTPTSAALRGETSRSFGLLVEVRDDRNLQGTGLLSLTLAPRVEGTIQVVDKTVDDGCQTAGGGFGFVALGLVILALRRR